MQYTIGIDGNEANVHNRVGSNVYAFEMLYGLHRWLEETKAFTVTVYLAQEPLSDLPAETDWWQYQVVPHVPFWTLWRLPISLWQHQEIDFFFSPGHYTPLFSPVPIAPTIMDLAFELYSDQFLAKDYWQLHLLTQRSVQNAAHVFAISEATKADIVEMYQCDAEEISVVYPGLPEKVEIPSSPSVEQVLQSKQISAPYIIFVGTLQPRKNIERLIGAFERVRQNGWDGELVLAGKIGWKSESIVQRIETSSAKKYIRQLGFVSDAEKSALIAGAEALVLPGLYEGFGIPPLEAVALGTVPVVSDVSSLPEVVGEDGICVDPDSVEDIARGIEEVLACSAAERNALLQKLQSHTQQFSWDASAKVLGEKLTELVRNTRRA